MASRQKQSEGISLLSMYNDEDDEEMEDVDDQEHENGEEQQQIDERKECGEPEQVEAMATDGSPNEVAPRVNSTPTDSLVRPTTPQQQQQVTQVSSPRRRKRGRLTIVDYGHDEVAMSPEHEEGEFGEEMQYINGVVQENTQSGTVQLLTPGIQATPFSSEILEQSQNAEFNNRIMESESVDFEDASKGPAENVDALDKFLPPPTKEKCPEELQRRIEKFIALKKVGRSFNAEVRNKKDYRNPDFLLHAVRYQDIDQIGSCFSKDVFDPHGYDKSYYYDEIEADMRCDKERKEQELKRSPRVDFIPGGTQPGTVIPASKFSMPVPVVTSSGLPTIADAAPRDSRPNKKSKWDKVDGDVRSTLPPAGQDSLAAAAAHAALLSAANVGAGYTAYVQQKRREAEERRSSERKLERRS